MKHRILVILGVISTLAFLGILVGPNTVLAADDEGDAAIIEELNARGRITSASITWATDVTTSGKIEYGTEPGVYTKTVLTKDSTKHNVNLTGLTEKTAYYFRVTATTLEGVETKTEELSFVEQGRDLMISLVDVWDVSATKAMILVKTNLSAYTNVYYGTAPDALTEMADTVGMFSISGWESGAYFPMSLKPNTTYYYQARAVRGEWIDPIHPSSTESGVGMFTTSGVPKITSISPTKGNKNTILTINGMNFGVNRLDQAVAIGCTLKNWPDLTPACLAKIVSWSDTKIVVKVGSNAKTGRIYVGKGYFNVDTLTLFVIKGPTFTVK